MTFIPARWLQRAYVGLVGLGFHLLYNQLAFTYDAVSWLVSLGEWRCWQRATLKHLTVSPPARILELAHGTANLQLDLYTLGYRPYGIDLSSYMGRIARRKLQQHRITSQLVRARAEALPFPSSSMDAIVCTFPTIFILAPATLTEVQRVLRPEGRLIFVPNGMLTGRGPVQGGIELAFRATGQRGPWPSRLDERFAEAGLHLTWHTEACPRSIAQVGVAVKLP